MSAYTYNDSLPTDRDWVRFLIGDRGTTNAGSPTFVITGATLSDGEINGMLSDEVNKWYAAARAAEALLAQNKTLASKSVEDLSVSFAQGKYSSYAEHIAALKERGAQALLDASSTTSKGHTMWNV